MKTSSAICAFALTVSSALASTVLTATVAIAQPAPQPTNTTTTPPATTTPAAAPPAKDAVDDNPIPKALRPSRFRLSSLGWTTTVSANAVGVGRDFIGNEDDYAGMDFYFSPQYWFYDEKNDKLFVNLNLGITTELTDSASTLTKREAQFTDMSVGLGYNRSIFTSEDGEWLTRLFIRARGILPTSPISQGQGRYFTSSLGASVMQVFKLLGNDADGLNNLTVIAGVTWQHLFSRSFTPTNEGLERARQSAQGGTILSDQLSFSSFDIDRVIPGVFGILPIYGDLSLQAQFRLIGRFRHDFKGDGCDAQVMGQCVEAQRSADRVSYVTNSTVDLSINQGFYNILWLTLGYNNETLTLGEDGQARNVFYSPSATFYADLSLQLDQVYGKVAGGSKGGNPNKQSINSRTSF